MKLGTEAPPKESPQKAPPAPQRERRPVPATPAPHHPDNPTKRPSRRTCPVPGICPIEDQGLYTEGALSRLRFPH